MTLSTLQRVCLGSCVALFGVSFILDTSWMYLFLAVALGLLWVVGQALHWTWSADFCLSGLVFLASIGVFLGHSPVLLLVATTIALVAWDLDRFMLRIKQPAAVADHAALIQRHLLHILAVAIGAILLGTLGLTVRISLSFTTALLLSFVALFVLTRLLRAAK
jgi:hypothetical protein